MSRHLWVIIFTGLTVSPVALANEFTRDSNGEEPGKYHFHDATSALGNGINPDSLRSYKEGLIKRYNQIDERYKIKVESINEEFPLRNALKDYKTNMAAGAAKVAKGVSDMAKGHGLKKPNDLFKVANGSRTAIEGLSDMQNAGSAVYDVETLSKYTKDYPNALKQANKLKKLRDETGAEIDAVEKMEDQLLRENIMDLVKALHKERVKTGGGCDTDSDSFNQCCMKARDKFDSCTSEVNICNDELTTDLKKCESDAGY